MFELWWLDIIDYIYFQEPLGAWYNAKATRPISALGSCTTWCRGPAANLSSPSSPSSCLKSTPHTSISTAGSWCEENPEMSLYHQEGLLWKNTTALEVLLIFILFICRFRTATRLCWKRGFKITSSSEDSPIITSQLDGSGFLSPISSSHQEGQLLQNTQIHDFHRITYGEDFHSLFFKDWGIWRGGTRKDEGDGEGTEDSGWRTRRTEDRGRAQVSVQ